MRITVSAQEVDVPAGGYNDPDDGVCRGCGAIGVVWENHTLLRCLQQIREDHEKAIAKLQEQIDNLSCSEKV